jgi:hypothetical protein
MQVCAWFWRTVGSGCGCDEAGVCLGLAVAAERRPEVRRSRLEERLFLGLGEATRRLGAQELDRLLLFETAGSV